MRITEDMIKDRVEKIQKMSHEFNSELLRYAEEKNLKDLFDHIDSIKMWLKFDRIICKERTKLHSLVDKYLDQRKSDMTYKKGK